MTRNEFRCKCEAVSLIAAEELSKLNQEFDGGVKRPSAKIIEQLNINRPRIDCRSREK